MVCAWLGAAVSLCAASASAGPVVVKPVDAGLVSAAIVPASRAQMNRAAAELDSTSSMAPIPDVAPDGLLVETNDARADVADEPTPKLTAKRMLAPERVRSPTRSAIEALAQEAAPFDGSSSESAVWSEEPGSVRTLGVDHGYLSINGQKPRELKRTVMRGGVTERALIHPDSPDLLVMLYHSEESMEGFKSQTGKVERLAPLSAAEAAPEIVEHGEASLPGLGRVYFYVQKLVHGAKLSELPFEAWPTGAVEGLFGRLERAGLKLEALGPDASRLASQILAGEDGAGGVRAYLLDGKTEPGTAEALRKHYAMLEALLPEVDETARNGLDPRLKDAIAKARSAAAAAPLAERVLSAREERAIPPPAASAVRSAPAPKKRGRLAAAGLALASLLSLAGGLLNRRGILWTAILGTLAAATFAGMGDHLSPLAKMLTGLAAGVLGLGLMQWLPSRRPPKPVNWRQRSNVMVDCFMNLSVPLLGLFNLWHGLEGAADLLVSPTTFWAPMAGIGLTAVLMPTVAWGGLVLQSKLARVRSGVDFPGRRFFELLQFRDIF